MAREISSGTLKAEKSREFGKKMCVKQNHDFSSPLLPIVAHASFFTRQTVLRRNPLGN